MPVWGHKVQVVTYSMLTSTAAVNHGHAIHSNCWYACLAVTNDAEGVQTASAPCAHGDEQKTLERIYAWSSI